MLTTLMSSVAMSVPSASAGNTRQRGCCGSVTRGSRAIRTLAPHRLPDDPIHLIRAAELAEPAMDVGERAARLVLAAHVEHDAADVGLVRDRARRELDRDREAGPARHLRCAVRRRRDTHFGH